MAISLDGPVLRRRILLAIARDRSPIPDTDSRIARCTHFQRTGLPTTIQSGLVRRMVTTRYACRNSAKITRRHACVFSAARRPETYQGAGHGAGRCDDIGGAHGRFARGLSKAGGATEVNKLSASVVGSGGFSQALGKLPYCFRNVPPAGVAPAPKTLPLIVWPYRSELESWYFLRVSSTEPSNRGSCGLSWAFMK